ncbi:MAG TPA: class I SAM-dependent methyltransferase [Methanothrix sp.]|nr:class I SAM-dependent methyltransferase [Methanothrix sp.]HRW82638.1 class I SAM-dependent methyltransferase [Methanothrix sp.]
MTERERRKTIPPDRAGGGGNPAAEDDDDYDDYDYDYDNDNDDNGLAEVYEPAEDTYLLLAAALEEVDPEDLVLEIGCGRGVISRSLAPRARRVIATDVNPFAVRSLRGRPGIEAVRADLFRGIGARARFDLIIFNPPYLPTEEDEVLEGWLNFAFDGGETGRETIDRFLEGLKDHLAPRRGRALLLVSSLSDPEKVREKAEEEGLAVEVVAREKHFFEELLVLRLTPRLSGTD